MTTELIERHPLTGLRHRVDRLFRDVADHGDGVWSLAMDVTEEAGALVVTADVPGLKAGDIEIAVADGILTISGTYDEGRAAENERCVRRERHHGPFSRSMTLPPGTRAQEARATVVDGILEMRIPNPHDAPRRIVEIKANERGSADA